MTERVLAQRHRFITEENSRWWTLGAMCFALFMLMLDNTVVNIALPSIQHDLHASLSALLWTVNAYTLTFAVLLVTGGRLGDIFGRRKLFLFGVLVFGIASLAIGFAPNDTVLVAFRAVQGVGAAFMMPATLSIITQAFPPHQRGTAIGTWAGVSALALAIGPVIGGFLTEAVSWRAIFFINPPIAVIAIAVTLFAARESRDETVGRTVDLPGIAALTVGLTALVLALIESNTWHWGSTRVIGLLALAAFGLAAFVAIERRVRAPMVDFAFFRSRTSAGANLVGFLVTFGMFAQFFFITLYLQNVLHYSALQTGLRFLPATIVIIIMGPLAGRLTDRVGPRSLMTLGLLIVAGAMLIQSRINVHSGYGLLLPGFILMGLGMGLVMSPMSTAAMNAVDRTKSGAASGVLSMSRMVGGSVGLAAMGALVTTVGRDQLQTALPHLSSGVREHIVSALGSGGGASGAHHVAPQITDAVHAAFISALGTGLEIGCAVMVVGAAIAWTLIERSPARSKPEPAARPEAPAQSRRPRPRSSLRPSPGQGMASSGAACGRTRPPCPLAQRPEHSGWVRLRAKAAHKPQPSYDPATCPRAQLQVAVDLNQVSIVEAEPGELPRTMAAWVIRPEREGEPVDAFQLEEIEVPEPGAFEVIVRVMAAGVNYNNVWAAQGKPVSVFPYGDHPHWGHHIGGSDASGIVWKVGPGVTRWKPGDEVVIHCNQASYEDPEVHGFDPLAAPSQLIWGYETTWGSFAQFTKVQAQQLLPRPQNLTWEEAASYGLVYFTAYRMLIDQCDLKAGDRVLVWGAAGGLGVFAVQLCAAAGAACVGVVSSDEKGRLVMQLGAKSYLDRNEFVGMMRRGGETPDEEKARFKESRRFAKAVKEVLGDAPDIVFEHVGKATFPTSVFAAKPFGKVVICAGTTGYHVDFDVRHLWMRQKQIIGSHFANAYECMKANELIEQGKIRPVLWRTMGFEGVPEAHQLMKENKHCGKISILVGAPEDGMGKTAPGPGAIHAEVGA